MPAILTRRQLISGALATPFCLSPHPFSPIKQSLAQTTSPSLRTSLLTSLGVHLPLWHQGDLNPDIFWNKVFIELQSHNINQCLILIYRFIDPVSGAISTKSQYKNAVAPTLQFIEAGMKISAKYKIKCCLYPMLEIDNQKNIGNVWRGFLNFFGVTLKNFFTSYNKHIKALAILSNNYNAPKLYIGSELASLSHNIAAKPYWEQLIYELRSITNNNMLLTYAAHWEEYLTVPFWRQLDEIGIDAYFPLVDSNEARGIGEPSQTQIEAGLRAKLQTLKTFASRHQRPLSLSEFGLTPYDQSTALPWQQFPTQIRDEEERLSAYNALFDVIKNDQTWLSSINLWHWQLPGRQGSAYNITPNSPLAKQIKSYAAAHSR